MLSLSQINLHPVKSLGGIAVKEANITHRGFENDRRWMVVRPDGKAITQREIPAMALLRVKLEGDMIELYHQDNAFEPIQFPTKASEGIGKLGVQVWNGRCDGLIYSQATDDWFQNVLGVPCHLVYQPEEAEIAVDAKYARNGDTTAYTDGFPFLIIGQASLDDLNSKLEDPVPMNRFRPSFVFTGGEAFAEDHWKEFSIGDHTFYGVKLCARCSMTTIDQNVGQKSKEPLKTLATYRTIDGNVMFGQNLLHKGSGVIKVGDPITVAVHG